MAHRHHYGRHPDARLRLPGERGRGGPRWLVALRVLVLLACLVTAALILGMGVLGVPPARLLDLVGWPP